MEFRLGEIRSDFYGFNSLAAFAGTTEKLFFDKVDIDLSTCSFFDANMVAPLYSIVANLYERLNDVSFCKNIPCGIRTILQKNCFLHNWGEPILPDTNQTTLPFKIFKSNAGEQFFEYLVLHMNGKGIPRMSKGLDKKFKQSLFEIFQNSAQHSHSTSGIFACGQFYPNKHRLDFSISDSGIGIRENVRKFLRNKISSCSAIEWALHEGNSTKEDKPGGLGLKLIKDFVEANDGKFQIVSRYGFYEFTKQKTSIEKMENDFPGTCVNIEINTNDTNSYCLKEESFGTDIF